MLCTVHCCLCDAVSMLPMIISTCTLKHNCAFKRLVCTDETTAFVFLIFHLLDFVSIRKWVNILHLLEPYRRRGVCPYPNPTCYCTICPYVPVIHFRIPFCYDFGILEVNVHCLTMNSFNVATVHVLLYYCNITFNLKDFISRLFVLPRI